MIYVLSGIAKSGKSLIADDIIKTYYMRVISTDLIMMMLHYGNDQLSIDINNIVSHQTLFGIFYCQTKVQN